MPAVSQSSPITVIAALGQAGPPQDASPEAASAFAEAFADAESAGWPDAVPTDDAAVIDAAGQPRAVATWPVPIMAPQSIAAEAPLPTGTSPSASVDQPLRGLSGDAPTLRPTRGKEQSSAEILSAGTIDMPLNDRVAMPHPASAHLVPPAAAERRGPVAAPPPISGREGAMAPVTGPAVTGHAVTGPAVTGHAVTGQAVAGQAVTGPAVTGPEVGGPVAAPVRTAPVDAPVAQRTGPVAGPVARLVAEDAAPARRPDHPVAAEAIGPRPQTDVLLEVTPTLRRPESAANPPPPVATPGQSSPLQADGFAPLARPEGRAPVPPIPADATAAPAERPATWPDQTVSRPLPPGIGQDVAAAKLPDPPAGQGPVPASSAATEGAGKAPRAEAPEPARATALPEGAREAASPAEKPAPGPAVPLIGAETAEPAATEVDEGESAPDRPVPKQEQAAVPSAAPLGRSVAVYRIEAASVLMNGDSELIMEAGGMTEFAPTGTITHWPSSLSGAAAAPVSAAAPTAALSAPMIQVLSGPRDGVTEIALSPEELGHVRLTFRKAPADPERLVLMVAFERPESLDLFRRNADQLLSDIRAAGYAGVDLSFSHWGGEGRNPSSPPQSQTPGTAWQADETATNIAQPPRLLLPSSLDLRL